ncbi:PP2C family protein-serine/threonine phosphatase [Streptomyces achromogenes]|uniref:PP2C family protein-serine/threonine phosphatase n=1 Tax=Streptomyces achromogenes TaxID=67255 RepID=UPI0027D87414|nr:PP2C family protein-serine/threonine phosphatase [Streptomyces achromogenes]
MRATWWQGPAPVVQLSLRRVDHADRFAVLSQQVGALHREIAIRRTAEAQREELLFAEQAARARLQRLYQLTAVLASSATLAQVAEAVAATAARVLDEDHIGLSIGDVAGHGSPQAAVMAQIIAALRGIVLRCGTRPEAVLTELNEYLHLYHRGQMATAAYLLYHRPTRTLTYVKAGHPPPLVVRPDGSSRYLDGPICPPVGPVPGARYHQGQTTLAEGEAVSCSTPTASSNAAGKPWTPAWTGSPRRPFGRRHERARSVRAVPHPPARRRLPRRPRPAPRPARLAQPTSPLDQNVA